MANNTRALRGRPVTVEEARVAVQRLINSHFHNENRARCSIPVDSADDDVTASDYVAESAERIAALEAQVTTITAERDAMLKSGAAANTALTIAQLEAENAAYASELAQERAERESISRNIAELAAQSAAQLVAAKRQNVLRAIDRFQDIAGWQTGNSRNALICAIRDKVDLLLPLTAPAQEAQKENTNG